LLQVVQQIEDAPAVALTIEEPPDVEAQHQQQQQQPKEGEQQLPAWRSGINQPVEHLLQELGLSDYLPVLQRERIDMAALQLMQEQHFQHLGLPIGAIVKIQAALLQQDLQLQQMQHKV
jgi:hypothetical protein